MNYMLVTKTLAIVVFSEERPVISMVSNMGDMACRPRFSFVGAFPTIWFLNEPVSFDGLPDR